MNTILEDTIKTSHTAFKNWRTIPFEDRQNLIKNIGEVLLENKETYAKLMTEEMGKPISQALAEIEKCTRLTDFYSSCENVLKPIKYDNEFAISEVHFEPLGTILGIMPWNFPLWQAIRFIIPTILAGNTVLLKHASICLGSGDAIAELFLKAGFPEGIVQHQKISHEEIAELIENPMIQGVSLTGSEAAGRAIAELAGKNLKKAVLELGGNDAFIICEDADLKNAAENAAKGRLHNYGQTCISAKRFIIHEKVYDEFMDLFINEYTQFESKNPLEESTYLSQMARKDLADDLEKQYNTAVENGATPLQPLKRTGDKTFQQGLMSISLDNPIADKELFGPLGMVLKGKDDEELISIANNTSYGLGNSVWTKNKERAMKFARNLESGTVAINQVTKSDPRFPFGGIKNSGYGIELSTFALREFVSIKTILGVNI